MKSIGTMLELIHGLCDTKDLSPWENEMVKGVYSLYLERKKTTTHLTGKQCTIIEQLHDKHFA